MTSSSFPRKRESRLLTLNSNELFETWVPAFAGTTTVLIIPFPNGIKRRVNQKFQNKTGEKAAHHGGHHALNHVGAGPGGPHERNHPHHGGRTRHHFGPHAFDRAVHNGFN